MYGGALQTASVGPLVESGNITNRSGLPYSTAPIPGYLPVIFSGNISVNCPSIALLMTASTVQMNLLISDTEKFG